MTIELKLGLYLDLVIPVSYRFKNCFLFSDSKKKNIYDRKSCLCLMSCSGKLYPYVYLKMPFLVSS